MTDQLQTGIAHHPPLQDLRQGPDLPQGCVIQLSTTFGKKHVIFTQGPCGPIGANDTLLGRTTGGLMGTLRGGDVIDV